MTERRVLLNGTVGNADGDGSTWDDGVGGTSAYKGQLGYVAAVVASTTPGDIVWTKGASTGTENTNLNIIQAGLTFVVNPVQIIAVRTDAGDTITKDDIIRGLREGDTTRAYDQTGAEAPPKLLDSAKTLGLQGGLYGYGQLFEAADDNMLIGTSNAIHGLRFEECHFKLGGTKKILMGHNDGNNSIQEYRHCKFELGSGPITLIGSVKADYFDCVFSGATTAGVFTATSPFSGLIRLYDCDLTGVDDLLVNIQFFRGGRVEFHNCRMPLNHILTTGTATGLYTVANYGSEDNTGISSGASEQALETVTHFGTVDIEPTIVRTGGASDGATGAFAWALATVNVTDNVVGVVSPWLHAKVVGDGTEKTLTLFISNGDAESGANLLQDNELKLEVMFPSETGLSMGESRPNHTAPRSGTLAYDAQTANFTVGKFLTGGTSGAVARIAADQDDGDTGTLTLTGIDDVFQTNETITDDNGSPGSATSDGTVTVTENPGKMQLAPLALGTPVNLSTDGSTWVTGGNNKQKLTQKLSPDYTGPLACRLIYSKGSGPTLYLDALPAVT